MIPVHPHKINRDYLVTDLGKPVDWDDAVDGTCDILPAVRLAYGWASYWQLSWREWWDVVRGRPVRVTIASGAHPPIMLDTEN